MFFLEQFRDSHSSLYKGSITRSINSSITPRHTFIPVDSLSSSRRGSVWDERPELYNQESLSILNQKPVRVDRVIYVNSEYPREYQGNVREYMEQEHLPRDDRNTFEHLFEGIGSYLQLLGLVIGTGSVLVFSFIYLYRSSRYQEPLSNPAAMTGPGAPDDEDSSFSFYSNVASSASFSHHD